MGTPGTPAAMVLAVRRMAEDWGIGTIIANEAIDASETAIDVVSVPSGMVAGQMIEWDLELMAFVSGTTTPITVLRGQLGTTATTHTTGTVGVIQPRFPNPSILECLNEAIHILNTQAPREVWVTDATILITEDETESFAMPTEPTGEGDYLDIRKVQLETSTTGLYREHPSWEQEGSHPPVLKLLCGPTDRAIRVLCTQEYLTMAMTDVAAPVGLTERLERFLIKYAAGLLLENASIYAANFYKQDTPVASDFGGRMQVVGRNLQEAAMTYLSRTEPASHSITLGDARNYRR